MSKYSSYQAHPWHGVQVHPQQPNMVNVYVEIVPTDVFKYEIDKESGLLKIDRPQVYSNICPANYGFIPQTYCGARVAAKASLDQGDGDPLDICVFSERPITHGNLLLEAIPIGGLRLSDRGQADDKIIAVLKSDAVYGAMTDLSSLPVALVDRLKHYFLTYKNKTESSVKACLIKDIYGAEEAREVIRLSAVDYKDLLAKA
jgi:inorganic pyrophosphatase